MVTTALSGKVLDAREVARLLRCAGAIAHSSNVGDDGAASTLDLVCSFTGSPLGHFYLVDQQRKRLMPTKIWHVDDAQRYSAFVEDTRLTPLSFGIGLPGQILASGKPRWIVDIRRDSSFPRARAARECGIGASFGFPIVSSAGIDGVLEFFADQPMEPDELLLDLLAQIGLELGTAFDRVRAQVALATSETRLAEAERLGRMGGWIYDVENDVLEWSEQLHALYGLDPTTTPRTLSDYLSRVHPDDVDRVRAAIVATIESGEPFEHEYRLLLRAPEIRWAHSRGEMLPRGEDGVIRIAGYCQDITDRKLKEDAARISQERLDEAQRLAHLGSWSWEATTNSVTWSDELFRIYGLQPGSTPPTFEAYLRHVHPDDRERVRHAVQVTSENHAPFEHEYRIVWPSGEERWVLARGEVVEYEDGVAARLAGYCQDITERRSAEEEREQLERQLHQSQRLENLGQLAGGVAHDFNNLLAVILNFAAFVDEEIASIATSNRDERFGPIRADVEQIARAARRASELTRQLLAFGRREVMRPRILNLNEVVRDVEQLLRRTIGEHVELHTRLAPDLRLISADPGQLEQVLVNLAVNARDAMPTGGDLTIETCNVHMDADIAAAHRIRPGSYVQLQVSDTGHGMSREVAMRAFEPFFTTKPKGEGTGLGLATVFGIVAQAGGAAHIDSELGRGTTVSVTLPATDREATAPEQQPVAFRRGPTGGETVLLVENESAMREVTRRMLARHGYQVLSAANGAEAIGLARHHRRTIHLLVTDVVMPQMLGKEVAAAITALAPDARILYMSGYAQPVLASQGTLEPGDALVEKPFTEDELLTKVREILDRS